MELERFVGATLARRGCVTQEWEAGRVEALLGAPVATSLGLPDEVCLRLRGPAATGEHQAGYGSGLLSQICALAETEGRCFRVELAPAPPKRERVERDAATILAFQNGVARVESIEEIVLDYLVVDFRYAALSEDQHEGMISIAIHASGAGSSPDLAARLAAYVTEHPETIRPWSGPAEPPDLRASYAHARRLALARLRGETQPFLVRMQRRLERDTHRVEDYYAALHHEVESRRTRAREDTSVLRDKIAAIESEKHRRLQDLHRRYAVRLRLQPLAAVSVRVLGLVLEAQVQRRKRSTRVQLGWNAISREFDRWTCDACGAETRVPALCESLHRLCPSCPSNCRTCGCSLCPACGPAACRCEKGRKRILAR